MRERAIGYRGLGCRHSGPLAYSPQPNSLSAFTLIEVLLAALIMGFGLSVLLVGTSRCLQAMKAAQNFQTAQWIMGLGEAEHPFLATNDVEALNVPAVTYPNGCVYERTVEDDDDKDGLYVVRSRVSWPTKNKRSYEETVRYVYNPDKLGLPQVSAGAPAAPAAPPPAGNPGAVAAPPSGAPVPVGTK